MEENTKTRGGARGGAGRPAKAGVRLSGKMSLETDVLLRKLAALYGGNRTAVIEAAIRELHTQKKADGSL